MLLNISVEAMIPMPLSRCFCTAQGLLVTRGANVMSAYVDNSEATAEVLHDLTDGGHPWYTNLGDMVFWLTNPEYEQSDAFSFFLLTLFLSYVEPCQTHVR